MTKLVKKNLNQNIYVSDGNTKLQENDYEFFLIWSLPAVITCPWRTKHCEYNCYAKKAELMYPDCLPCRQRNWREAEKPDFVTDMAQIIQWNLNRPSKKSKQCYFRIHESGDFYSVTYTRKWIAIAKMFPQVIFMAYTKSLEIIEMLIDEIPENLVIRASVWSDTDNKQLDLIHDLDLPIYTAGKPRIVEYMVREDNYTKCEMDCTNCKACYIPNNKKIVVEIH